MNPITLTGADERTDLPRLAKVDCEVGILLSLNGMHGRNRYPHDGWINDALRALPRVALHVCGRRFRDFVLRGGLHQYARLPERVQLNGNVSNAELETVTSLYPTVVLITQWQPGREGPRVTPKNGGQFHQLLVDSSGGRGISHATPWPLINTTKRVGFSGGLGPSNLLVELERMKPALRDGWWVDMESSLRENDWFSVGRAEECAGIMHQFIKSNSDSIT